jgi:hypothetical protein
VGPTVTAASPGHTRASPQLLGAQLLPQCRHRRDELERRSHRALRVVLRRHRRAPNCHHCIPDELLDGSSVQLDQTSARGEVTGEKIANLLGVARLGQRRETDEIGEQNGNEATL